ncbi:MAG: HAMP domain-containing sensor histidine kinase [Dethiobacteria bacterium]|jgi:signal transduction histidine kinase|nr:HAMP domain-containing sensor histidine kinase [Bacillota bacterium]HPT34139.1 HAMP domain-containing sensor histidine kinase [Bacillota bacterium]HPZ64030.1 HAMP domain-containing sensor histidine kinase [Bacillota bacterium]HQD06088.1 HAMP domain-containing sensor histidine kinase [Bacillota bacterium]
MKPRRVFARLLLSYLAITLVVLAAVSLIFVRLMHRYFFNVEGVHLTMRSERIAALVEEHLYRGDLQELSTLVETLAFSNDIYLWVTDKEGKVLEFAGSNPERLGLRVEQHEIEHVLAGNVITKQITGPGYNSLFHMAPLYVPGYEPQENWDSWEAGGAGGDPSQVIGTLAISSPLGSVTGIMGVVTRLGMMAALGGLFLAVGIGYTLSRKIASPLEEMSAVAMELSRGNYNVRVNHRSDDEVGRLAETLNFAIDKVSGAMREQQQTLKLQRELISDISHEFRAPLTTLQGFLELMLRGKIPEAERERYLEMMHRDTVYLGGLVRDLIDLENLEIRRETLERRPADGEELLAACLENLQLKGVEKGVKLELQVEEKLPLLMVDERRFYQVMINLVENALRFSPRGGTIRVRAHPGEGGVFFYVSDEGPGIPKEEQPFIWNRFYKVDKARSRQETGCGLGLAIVRRIVELHGGWITVESEPGCGTTFTFWLPAAPEQ